MSAELGESTAPPRAHRWCALPALALALGVYASPRATLADRLVLDPAKTRVHFSVNATLHTVHGTAQMTMGEIEFSPGKSAASGHVVIDARSLETGNGMRDSRMHSALLESERFPTIELIAGSLTVEPGSAGSSHVDLEGQIKIHGGSFPVSIPAEVEQHGNEVRIHAHFSIPYVKWGMKDMSLFLLTVSPVISVEIDAEGRVLTAGSEQSSLPGREMRGS